MWISEPRGRERRGEGLDAEEGSYEKFWHMRSRKKRAASWSRVYSRETVLEPLAECMVPKAEKEGDALPY